MTTITVSVAGVTRTITDISETRAELTSVRDKLRAIYAGFDPAHPEGLIAREAEIVDLANRGEILREIIERWEAAEGACDNVLAAWALVQAFTGEGS